MAHGDRFTLSVKRFGRKVIIKVNRGRITPSEDGTTATITYRDSPVRGPREPK